MNYILIIIFLLAIYKFTEQKENFEILKSCMDCRKELSLKKRKEGKKVDPVEIINECINQAHCAANDMCNYCVTKDKSKDENLIKTVDNEDYGTFKVDLNNCKKFRTCRDTFLDGYCNTPEFNREGGEKYCCQPCVSSIRANIDESDEDASDLAKTCRTNLKLDEEKLWNDSYDNIQGVCSRKTIEDTKARKNDRRQKDKRNRERNIRMNIMSR